MEDIDLAKGIAMVLVVYGHIVATTPPAGNEWYPISSKLIYYFHMPFFMYLSGYMMFYTFRPFSALSGYGRFIWKKIVRLAPGFLFFGVLILVGKILASNVLVVDNMPTGFWDGLLSILITPGSSAAGSLWFVYVLLELYILTPVLLFLTRNKPEFVILIALIVFFVPATRFFMLHKVSEFLIFFSVGMVCAKYHQQYTRVLDKFWILFGLLFAISFAILLVGVEKVEAKLVIGMCSLFALHSIARLTVVEKAAFLKTIGIFSLAIYFMNTIAIGVVKGITLKFVSWHGSNFLFIAPLLLLTGIYGPLLVKKYIFSRIPPLDRITS